MRRSKTGQKRTETYYAWGVCGFLLLAVGLIYGQTLGHVLLKYDDNYFVWENSHVTPGLTGQGIWWAFSEGPYGEWYPLSPLSHMLDCQLFGLDAWGHHLTNVLLHGATSIALFLVWWRFTRELWPSAFVAAIFAVHPQHVESVAWVSERKDVLSGLFFVLTLGAYLGYVRHGRSAGRYLLVAILFALGLMSKPMLVTLPPLLLLLDFWPLGRIGKSSDNPRGVGLIERPGLLRLVLEKLPLVALAAGDCWITMRTHAEVERVLPLSLRAAGAAVAGVSYVAAFFWPVDLAAFYPIPPGGPPGWKVAGAFAILAFTTAAAVAWRRKCPYCFVGWFWYLGMLSPVLGLIRIGELAMADRYMYLPGIGLSIALAWGAARLGAGLPERRWMLAAGTGLSIAALAGLAAWQTSFWHDDETLWRRALAVTTDNAKAEVELGHNLAQQGRLDEAIVHYRRNLELEPDIFAGHVNLAAALTQAGRSEEAVEHLRRALEIGPDVVPGYVTVARLLIVNKKMDEARVALERAVVQEPNDSEARTDLGWVLFGLGKIDEAIVEYEAALAHDPDFVPAHVRLAGAQVARGRLDEAIDHYHRALALDPNNPRARKELDQLLGTPPGSTDRPPPH
jgi:tetratricopeptide (TPR) repeat protein